MAEVEHRQSQDRQPNGAGYGSAASHFFQPERFMHPNFNAEQYVADVRRYVSLVAPPSWYTKKTYRSSAEDINA